MAPPASPSDASRPEYTTPEGFEVRRLAGALGAEVRGLRLGGLDGEGAAAIERILLDHHVLFFPEQSPTVEEHVAFGRHYGELEGHPHLRNPTEGLPPEIFELSAQHGGVADEWHSDLTCLERPARYSILHMVRAASVGGDTMWANPAMAYDELSPPIRDLCDGLTAIHDGEPHGLDDLKTVHPVVRVHPETGRRVLFVNEHFTRRIVELSRDESTLLLGYLTRWIANPRFTVRYRWQSGTVALWDNRTTQHFVLNDFAEERVIQRVTVMGDRITAAVPPRWPAYRRVGGPSDTSRHEAEVAALGRDRDRPA
ncbi:MAG: TauD/TfdA family dioxygenase [Myxococcota bacterium]